MNMPRQRSNTIIDKNTITKPSLDRSDSPTTVYISPRYERIGTSISAPVVQNDEINLPGYKYSPTKELVSYSPRSDLNVAEEENMTEKLVEDLK